jgi:hypothetical protein
LSEFICSKCNKSGFIVSVEVITEAFPCGPDGKGGIEYDGMGGEVRYSTRSHFECRNCDTNYTESQVLALEVGE